MKIECPSASYTLSYQIVRTGNKRISEIVKEKDDKEEDSKEGDKEDDKENNKKDNKEKDNKKEVHKGKVSKECDEEMTMIEKERR